MSALTEEEERTATLEWIPRPIRTRMDEAGVRISLVQWQAMLLAERRMLAEAAQDAQVTPQRFATLLGLAQARTGA